MQPTHCHDLWQNSLSEFPCSSCHARWCSEITFLNIFLSWIFFNVEYHSQMWWVNLKTNIYNTITVGGVAAICYEIPSHTSFSFIPDDAIKVDGCSWFTRPQRFWFCQCPHLCCLTGHLQHWCRISAIWRSSY